MTPQVREPFIPDTSTVRVIASLTVRSGGWYRRSFLRVHRVPGGVRHRIWLRGRGLIPPERTGCLPERARPRIRQGGMLRSAGGRARSSGARVPLLQTFSPDSRRAGSPGSRIGGTH